MEKLKMHTPDLTQDHINRIRELFPNCVTEVRDESGKLKLAVDFDQLKQELSDTIVEGVQERYHLNWPGKREALLTANAPIAKTLRPCREESVDFDTTKNLFIEGDNLEALKLLQETYLGKIKMIYIDPPYNTKSDFVYNDDFVKDAVEYLKISNQMDDQGARLVANPESNGRKHSDWLSMLYTRLKLARNLLTDDGLIAIHIDENEYANLEKVLTEIYGEGNNLGTIVWDKRNPKGEVGGVAQQHEFISFYCKDKVKFVKADYFSKKKENAPLMLKKAEEFIKKNNGVNDKSRKDFKEWIKELKDNLSGGEKAYCFIDDDGNIYQPVSMAAPDKPETRSHRALIHPETKKKCPVPEKGWRFPDKTMDELLGQNRIIFGEDETTQPRQKYLLKENMREAVSSLLYFGGSDDALGLPFDNPKPIFVASKIIEAVSRSNDIILDFFAGSATTAHAAMQLNAEDGENRQFIMVQLPEICAEKSEAFKAGYRTIPEISKERIRRAGRKIIETKFNEKWNKDIGFRVLKIDSSNMAEVYYTPDGVKQDDLLAAVDNIRLDRSPEDLLFQVLLDWGVDLTLPIAKKSVQGKTVFFVDGNALVACFDAGITEELVKELAADKPLRVVFRDNGFASDSVKINAEQIFKQMSPSTDMKSI